jgi:hypothetical protein
MRSFMWLYIYIYIYILKITKKKINLIFFYIKDNLKKKLWKTEVNES